MNRAELFCNGAVVRRRRVPCNTSSVSTPPFPLPPFSANRQCLRAPGTAVYLLSQNTGRAVARDRVGCTVQFGTRKVKMQPEEGQNAFKRIFACLG